MTCRMVAANRSDESTAPCSRLTEKTERKFPPRVEHDHRQALSGADGWETVALPPEEDGAHDPARYSLPSLQNPHGFGGDHPAHRHPSRLECLCLHDMWTHGQRAHRAECHRAPGALTLLWHAIRGREVDWGGFQRSQRDVECARDPRRHEIEIGPALQLIDEAVLDQS